MGPISNLFYFLFSSSSSSSFILFLKIFNTINCRYHKQFYFDCSIICSNISCLCGLILHFSFLHALNGLTRSKSYIILNTGNLTHELTYTYILVDFLYLLTILIFKYQKTSSTIFYYYHYYYFSLLLFKCFQQLLQL